MPTNVALPYTDAWLRRYCVMISCLKSANFEGESAFCWRYVDLHGLARRLHEIPKHSNVWTVGTDSPRIHGQPEPLREIQINTGIIQFGKAEALSRKHAIQARRIHRPRRAVALPGAARQFVKLLPIAFVPGAHFLQFIARPLRRFLRLSFGVGCATLKKGSLSPALLPLRRTNPATAWVRLVRHSGDDTIYFPGQGIFLA